VLHQCTFSISVNVSWWMPPHSVRLPLTPSLLPSSPSSLPSPYLRLPGSRGKPSIRNLECAPAFSMAALPEEYFRMFF